MTSSSVCFLEIFRRFLRVLPGFIMVFSSFFQNLFLILTFFEASNKKTLLPGMFSLFS